MLILAAVNGTRWQVQQDKREADARAERLSEPGFWMHAPWHAQLTDDDWSQAAGCDPLQPDVLWNADVRGRG